MDPYIIIIGKESIEKESELIDIFIETKDEIEMMAQLRTFWDLLKNKYK